MVIRQPKTGYAPMQRQRKALFPFLNGMRSEENEGVGANRAENVWFKDNKLQKMDGTSVLKTIASIAKITYLGEFQKSDGTYQVIVTYPVSTYYVMRAIESDGTVVTPSGGAGDVHFTSSEFSSVQILALGFIGNNSATTQLYSWNGAALTAVANGPTLIRGVARDGKRLAIITTNDAKFSGDAITTDFTAGTGVNVTGDYSLSIKSPRAVYSAGMGIIIVGETGSEAHKVVTNAASDDVNADTKIDSYNDKEHGVTKQKQVTMGKEFIWRVTPEGIMRTNPFNGQTVNVTDMGKIGRYWKEWTTTDSAIAYDENNEQVVCAVKEDAQNDTLVCIDATREDLPVSIKPSQYYNVLASVDNQMYGGGSREGNVDKLFKTDSDRTGDDVTFRYITEWIPFTNQLYWKVFKNLHIAASLHPDSSMKVKIYFDGSTEATYTETFTTSDTIGEGGLTDYTYGMYIFGGSLAGIETANSDELGELKTTKKFSTMCVEVYETSGDEFEVHDMILEYKSKNKFYHQLTRKNVLFS